MLKQQDVLEPPIVDRLNQRLTTAQDREARIDMIYGLRKLLR
ncbi:hypothetical protein FOWG_17535 [Fusarium oxysporum f. sp. lycopersici MN25]|nr:hypothetical protein FOWG_17535 [Fusarium oxysporum f. sp. lycopersici MN25]